jgi:rhodanese-related sulfurtransferase
MSPNLNLTLIVLALAALVFLRRWLVGRRVRQYSAREAAERMQQKDSAVLLDVRTAGENRAGTIKGSLNIPLHELKHRLAELEKHRSGEIIVYCASGSRSVAAAYLLHKNGFTVANMRGGMIAWQSR